jgi:hypothetical protein
MGFANDAEFRKTCATSRALLQAGDTKVTNLKKIERRKPLEAFYCVVCGGLELFARGTRDKKWAVWGDEI